MMKVLGVVFDLDHTLFDRYATFEALQTDFYTELKKYLSEDATPRDIYVSMVEGDKRFLYQSWESLSKFVISQDFFIEKISEKDFIDIIFSCFSRKAVPYSFTLPMLEALRKRGFKLGLITNGKSKLQRKKLSMLGLENSFDEILISEEFGERKPNTSIFSEMSKRLSIPPCDLVYVGDHPINDIDAASKAGYKTVWVKTNGTWVEGCIKPSAEIMTVDELPSLLD